MSTFSYAAAARGQLTTTPPAPQSVTSQAASTASTQNADASVTANGTTPASESAPFMDTKEQDSRDTTPSAVQADSVNKTESQDAGQTAQGNDSAQKALSTETSATASPDKKALHEGSTERRGAKGPSARASDVSDNRKSRKGKKSRANDKEAEQEPTAEKEKEPELPKVQLTDAPIPSVNIWAQRAKDVQTKAPQPAPSRTPASTSGNQQDAKAKSAVNDSDNVTRPSANAVKGQKKDARDANEQGSRRHAPRGSRAGEKTVTDLPSVADAASWPTPETAATETRTQEVPAKSVEADDPQEEKAGSGTKDKPKWVAVPFVPTAVFETPLPTRNPRGSKTGAPRGGREVGPRGHATDRAQAAGSTRTSGDRSTEASNSTRPSTSAPVKRGSVDNAASRDVRKVPGSSKEVADASSSAQVNGTEETVKTSQSDNKEATSNQQQASSDGSNTEKRTETRPDPSREAFTPAARDSSNHHHASKSEKRGGRPRGGHPGANGQGHRGHGAYSMNGQSFQGRQNSYPGNVPMNYGMPGANGTNGHSSRNSTSGAFFRGRSGRGQNAQTPTSWNVDPSMQTMPPMPPQPYFYEQNILSLLQKQLSYYFSVNNLLKDSFLRRCMDSQGFVFLDVILSFQRIQQLTADVNMVRMACMECPEIELVTGQEDHRDRMRRLQGWEVYVYPKGQRNPEVNFDDGPVNFWKHDRNAMYQYQYPMASPFQMESPGFYPPNSAPYAAYGNDGFQHYMTNGVNGVNGHSAQKETQLSATVPEFSPKGGSSASDQDQTAAPKNAVSGDEGHVNGAASALANGASNSATQPLTNGAGDAGVGVAAH